MATWKYMEGIIAMKEDKKGIVISLVLCMLTTCYGNDLFCGFKIATTTKIKNWIDYWALVHLKYLLFYNLKDWQMQKKTFIGCINLGSMAKCVAGKIKKHGFLFYLSTDKETFLFKVPTNEQRHRWFKAIKESATKSNKIPDQNRESARQNVLLLDVNSTAGINLKEDGVESVSAPMQVNVPVNLKPLNIIHVLPYHEETDNKIKENPTRDTKIENFMPSIFKNSTSKNNAYTELEVVNSSASGDQINLHNIIIDYFC